MTATRVEAVNVVSTWTFEGVTVVETECPDYDTFRSLPGAVSFEGRVYGRSGWNSDTGRCYYRSDAKFAIPA